MPTYEYECRKCEHRFEKFQMMTDAPVKTCPECKGRKVKRLIGTGAGILFKGSGFYQTDYRSDGYHKQAKADKPGASEKSAGESGSKKPAKKDGESGAGASSSSKSKKKDA